jgi:ornithine cyclodeaminase/alanine dehydrogenase-like protein (mu-crystallin family)
VAIIGAGVQGRSHLSVVAHLLPGASLVVHDVDAPRAAALVEVARDTAGVGEADISDSARAAVDGADIVITAAAFTTPDRRQSMPPDWLADHALVVPVDYATICSAAVARDAALFLVDERAQFLANRDAGQFDDYPDPTATLGEALLTGTPRPPGRVVVTHLGVGLADVVFAGAILARAATGGLGIELPR